MEDESEGDEFEDTLADAHYLRTAIEEAIFLGSGTAWYWIDRERQVADWDFPSFSERLTLDVMRYDNNPFHVNFAWHAANGTGFHMWARANGLDFLESVAAGGLSSLVWEYALEYREKVSVNDLMYTTGAGIPMGEFMHVLGRYLNDDPTATDYPGGQVVRWTLGLPVAFTRMMDGVGTGDISRRRTLWHDIHLRYQLATSKVQRGQTESTHQLHTFHGDAAFVKFRRYRAPGSWSRWFRSAEFVSAGVDISLASEGSGLQMYADSVLLGWYSQAYHRGPDRVSTGLMVGTSLAYEYRRETLEDWDDRVGLLHLPGLAVDFHGTWNGFAVWAQSRFHFDFAGINAPDNEQWNAAHPDEQGKTVLRKQGYYYGYGASAKLSLQLQYRNIGLGGAYFLGHYDSDEGLDRIQEMLTVDQKSSDNIAQSQVWLQATGLPYRGMVTVRYSQRKRKSTLDEFSSTATLSRFTLELGFAL